MTDRDFLIWIHQRLEYVHSNSRLMDYMHKLRAIIRDMPRDKISKSDDTCNSLEELLEKYP